MKKKLIVFLTLFFMGIGAIVAQTLVRGTVVDETGEPVIGATIQVRGTTQGTVTDIDGNFSLSAPTSGVLIISYVGYVTQEVPVSSNVRVVLLPDTEILEELVVTAMGISREKKALGYAVQDLQADQLVQAASNNLTSALQGKVSGIEVTPSSGMPGASAKLTIRGSRSFTGDNTPLYVIDGMPVASTSEISTGNSVTGSDFATRSVDIDPNDIESVNILKGQAASALYGMRASNGVVVITTKSGKGARSGRPEITYNTSLSFDMLSATPNLQTEYAQGTGGKYGWNSSMSWGPKISELPNDPTYGGNTDNNYTKKDGMKPDMYYVRQRADAGLDPWVLPGVYDNVGDFFETGHVWNNSLNVAQSLEKGFYSFSLGNLTSKGIVPSTGMDRYNAKFSAEIKLNENWKTGVNGNFIVSELSKQTGANNGIVATVFPAPPSYDLAGIPNHIKNDPYRQNTYRGTAGFDGAYWGVEHNKFQEATHRFFGNSFVQYSTNLNSTDKTLDLKYQIGDDSYTTNYDDVWGYGHSNGRGEADHYSVTVNQFNSLFTANFRWDINEDLVFDALAGNEVIHTTRKFTEAYGRDFNFSGWNHIDNASVYQATDTYRRTRTVGTFANVGLSYRNYLFLNGTGRNDVVSTMPRGNRSFFYPSVSLGFIFTELEGLKNDILTFGKLRTSYAEVGQAGTYYDSYFLTPTYGGGFSSGTPISYPIGPVVAYTLNSTVYDPNLKPQNTKSYEFGTDLTFLNGLLTLNYTFSRQNVKDQIFEVPLAGSTGSGSLVTNGGSIHTNAHELTLGMNPVNSKNVSWDFAFNFSKIDNYVDELAPGVNNIFLGGFVEPQVRAGIGYKFPVIYGVSYLRNDAGQIIVNERGFPEAGPLDVIGTVSPDFQLGFNTTLELYKFRLSAVLDWRHGGSMYAGTATMLDYYGVSQYSADLRNVGKFMFIEDAVKVTATDADGNPTSFAPNDIEIDSKDAFAYLNAMNNISESFVLDNSYVKLREIALSYPILDKGNVRLSANVFARNLILWSAIKGFDPEASQGNNNMSGAFERFSLPSTSSYGIGLM
ncbi:MAG: SusC/RagA family TonB-linked outer membrane protein [Fermentimonas sp.]|nr:SusC/RagA family TonB-linked outer membrane protein [Fermentimonas sp.]